MLYCIHILEDLIEENSSYFTANSFGVKQLIKQRVGNMNNVYDGTVYMSIKAVTMLPFLENVVTLLNQQLPGHISCLSSPTFVSTLMNLLVFAAAS